MDRIKDVITRIARPELINYIFLGFLFLFLVDNIFNSTVRHMPIFVAGAIFLSLFFLAYLIKDYKKHIWLLTGITLMFMIMIVNSFKDGFHVRNISDLLFFVMYVLSYLAFFAAKQHLKLINAHVFILSTVFLFIVPLTLSVVGAVHPHRVGYSFKSGEISQVRVLNDTDNYYLASLNLNSSLADYSNEKEVAVKKDSINERKDVFLKENPFSMDKSFLDEYISFNHKSTENHRTYLKGFFRIPHVASYFFGFSAIFLAFLAFAKRKYLYLIPVFLLLVLSLITGVRSFLLALIISLFIYLMRRKYIPYLALLSLIGVLIIVFRHQIAEILAGTFLQQHFSVVTTMVDNFGRFSRVMIWFAWYNAVTEFSWYEFLIGKSYYSSLMLNKQLFGQAIWVHNDIFNMFYCYGVVGVTVYASFIVRIYKDCKQYIQGNIFIFLFFASSIIISFINGFYYYFTIFLMYLFVLMIAEFEKGDKPLKESID